MRARIRVVVVALAGTLACSANPALASPPQPLDLRVQGGEESWHPDNRFQLEWTNPPAAGPPLAATHYRIRDPQGGTIRESRIAWVSDGIAALTVPAVPGTYGAEVWLEDSIGSEGPVASARLRFDDARPAAIEPESVPDWIGRTAFPLRVRLGHPAGPSPLSGIRGYAVAIDGAASGAPCVAADRCRDDETTLRGGTAYDELTIAAMPEGTSYLHAVAVSGSGMKSASSGLAVLRVDTTDPVTHLSGAPAAGWTNRTVRLAAHAIDSGSGMEAGGDDPPPFTAIRIDAGAAAVAVGESATASVVGEGTHRIAYYARDAAGNVDDGAGSNGVANGSPRIARVRIDRTPPTAAFANSQDPRDPDLLWMTVEDGLSGPDPSRGWIGIRKAGSGDRFQPLAAEPPANGGLRARWSSDSFPRGDYEFQATAYDEAGNVTVTTQRRDGGRMVLANPLKATTGLQADFRSRGRQRTVRFGRSVLVGGRLTTGLSAPLGGRPVRIVERFAAPGPATRTSTAWTNADGAFSIRSAPGPSRTIAVSFEGSPTLARSAADELRLNVRSMVSLRASAPVAEIGGAPLVFRGRVGAAPETIPPEGKAVQLQFRLGGQPWSEFRTLQTDRKGRFRYAYRFSDDDSRGARFQFRAYATAEDNWPYEPGGSRPVLVRGI